MNVKVRTWGAALAVVMAMMAAPVQATTGAPPDATPQPDVVWMVIGIQPEHVRMEIDKARMWRGKLRNFAIGLDAVYSKDGFIVVKAQPNTLYGVGGSSLMFGKSIFGMRFKPCDSAPTFQTGDGGKVVYYATLNYSGAGSSADYAFLNFLESSTHSVDLEGARTFLKAHYPGLADNLEQGKMEVMPLPRKCHSSLAGVSPDAP